MALPVTLNAPEIVPADWPEPPDAPAFRGLAGEIASLTAPYTEADPVAVLAQSLALIGNQVGRGPHFRADGAYHALNLYLVLVGASSASRKGTSFAVVRSVFLEADPTLKVRIKSGLASGEGLIWQLRDPVVRRSSEGDEKATDEGVADKRLLVVEPEFARCLRILEREGSTLSAVIREAWDTGTLHSLTKNQQATATDAHLTLIGHITRDELRRYLTATETANGFANRFNWLAVRRPHLLPEGATLPTDEHRHLVREVRSVLEAALEIHEMARDDGARQLWRAQYEHLARPRPGLWGAVTSRAEAQAMRLASLYAVADRSSIVRREHLESGLALWEYFERCAAFVFGRGLGDPVADEAYRELLAAGERGLTRSELHDAFRRNLSAARLSEALELLKTHRGAYYVREEPRDGGRPTERWYVDRPIDERRKRN